MISIKELDIRQSGESILRLETLDIPNKGLFLITGDNGTGKTSLIRTILNIHSDYHGSISINGTINRDLGRRELAACISYLPQSVTVEADFTVSEYIQQGLYAVKAAYYESVIDTLGLARLLERRLPTLSGGEKQLCRLARVLIPDTAYVFLDEPDSFLSRKNRKRLLSCIESMSEYRSVLVISHYGMEYPNFTHLLDLESED